MMFGTTNIKFIRPKGVVCFTPLPFYPRKKSPVPIELMAVWTAGVLWK